MLSSIIGPLGSLASTWLQGRVDKAKAETDVKVAKAKAEAEKMAKKADAWKEYKEAAILDMMLESMPKVEL